MLRQPILTVMGHVDHGKTTFLDYIRKTKVSLREAGGITQHVGATEIPLETIEKICGEFFKKLNFKIRIPGILFIDTPGHKAFTNIRRRGGSIADLAILMIDINQGVQEQTEECIRILKRYKTPFIVALNKVDLIPGWKPNYDLSFTESYKKQDEKAREIVEKKVYEIVGELYSRGFISEYFMRVRDFRREVAIVPMSAVTGEGVVEVLSMVVGLVQQFLREKQIKLINKNYLFSIIKYRKKIQKVSITITLLSGFLRPLGESNPCCRIENPGS